MKKISSWVVYILSCWLLLSSYAFAAEIVAGYIIECSLSREFIQIKDFVYRVNEVWLDNGKDELKMINRASLKEGDLLEVTPGAETPDYRKAEKVVLVTGHRRKEVEQAFELEPAFPTRQAPSQTGEQVTSKPRIFLQNGVWKNTF